MVKSVALKGDTEAAGNLQSGKGWFWGNLTKVLTNQD